MNNKRPNDNIKSLLWKDGYSKPVKLDTYYACNDTKNRRDICINLKDEGQITVSTNDIIKILKLYKRI